jgi:hypothetical protein
MDTNKLGAGFARNPFSETGQRNVDVIHGGTHVAEKWIAQRHPFLFFIFLLSIFLPHLT